MNIKIINNKVRRFNLTVITFYNIILFFTFRNFNKNMLFFGKKN